MNLSFGNCDGKRLSEKDGMTGIMGMREIRMEMLGIGVGIIFQINLWKMKLWRWKIKVEHVKPIQEKLWKLYLLQIITEACAKIAVLEIYVLKRRSENL